MENIISQLQGPHKHCYSGVVAIGATFLVSAFLNDTSEVLLGVATLGALALYALRENPENEDTEQDDTSE